MAKIRGIKPDTWTDEKIVSVSPLARLLFIGMWNYCCDNGHIEDSPLQLKMRILPADNCDINSLLSELIDRGLVSRMDRCLKVPNLPEHQRPDKRFLTLCEHCDHDENNAYSVMKPAANPASTRRAPREDTTSAPREHVDECDGDGDGDGDMNSPSSDADASTEVVEAEVIEPDTLPVPAPLDLFETWWAIYDKKVGKRKAKQKWALAIKKRGVTPDLLIQSARRYVEHQKSIGKHPQFTKNPETWLNGEHWGDALIPLAPERNTYNRPKTGATTTDVDWQRWSARLAGEQQTQKEIA